MSTYVPSEFEYEMPPSPEPVVVSRSEAYLTTPSDKYDTISSRILRFELTGDQMVDLSSIRMYADMTYAKGVESTKPEGDPLAADDYVVSNMGLFQSIELTTLSGTVIERIDDANLLAVIMSHLCFSDKWSETTGSYSNSQKDIALHKSDQGQRLEINAHKLLGFFHTGKFIMPSLMGGGLRITFTLADAKKLIVLKDSSAGDLKLTLSGVRLHYDTCIMSQRYQEWFNRQYATKGFRIIWDSYQGHTQSSMTLGATHSIQQLPIQVTAKRCKALVMVLRNANHTTPSAEKTYSGAFLSEGFQGGGSYQLDVAGVRYPPTPIDSYPRAHEEAIKVCYSNNDVQTENIPLGRFSKEWVYDFPESQTVVTGLEQSGKNATSPVYAVTAAATFSSLTFATEPLTRRQGQFIMCLDFEKYNSSGESGIVIAPNSARVSLSLKRPAANVTDTGYELSSYLVRSQSLTVVGGQVVVDY